MFEIARNFGKNTAETINIYIIYIYVHIYLPCMQRTIYIFISRARVPAGSSNFNQLGLIHV